MHYPETDYSPSELPARHLTAEHSSFTTGHGRLLMAAPADRQQFQCHRQICYPLPVGTDSRPRWPDNFDCGFRIRDAAVVAVIFLTVVVPSAGVKAAELNECREMLIKGDYQACIEATHEAI